MLEEKKDGVKKRLSMERNIGGARNTNMDRANGSEAVQHIVKKCMKH